MSAIGRFTQSDDLEMINKMFYVFCIIPGMPGTLKYRFFTAVFDLTYIWKNKTVFKFSVIY